MRTSTQLVVLAGLSSMALAASNSMAQGPGFYYIGALGGQGQEVSTPFAIAPGPVVYGTNDYFRNGGNFRRAFIWSPATAMDPLASTPSSGTSSGAYAASADGSIMVGVRGISPGSSGVNPVVFRRVNGGPDETLPLAAGMIYPQVRAISSNGTTTVGYVNGYGGGGQAVTWLGTNTATYLPSLPGAPAAQALGVNGDGSVIVGWSGRGYPFDNTPVRWVNGQIESLGLPPGCSWAWAAGVSDDGNTIIGYAWVTGGTDRAFKWTPTEGMTLLEDGPNNFADAWSISGDGRLIGGRIYDKSVVWRDGVPYTVQTDLIPAGTSLSPFTGLAGNVVISRDGKTIAATERVIEAPNDGEYHAWAAVLPDWVTCFDGCGTPTCGSADFDGDGDSGTDFDIQAFFACLGGDCCPTCGSADFNADGDTGTDADIQSFFSVLGGGAC